MADGIDWGAMVPAGWRNALAPTLAMPGMAALGRFLEGEQAAGHRIFPNREDWFRALALTPPEAVRVVILGQDPYHGEGQAHGLAFSVRPGVRPPPSLGNIFRELASDLGIARPAHGSLEHWARQGVLLLNTVLTVEEGRAGSHARRGWEAFTDAAIHVVADKSDPVAFILWGAHAQKKAGFIRGIEQGGPHLVLKSAHPSPLSAHTGFLGSCPFSRANAFLIAHGRAPIDWSLPTHERT